MYASKDVGVLELQMLSYLGQFFAKLASRWPREIREAEIYMYTKDRRLRELS